jgi:hypothetical protein
MAAELSVEDTNTDTTSERDVFLASIPHSRITRVAVLADDTLADLIKVFSQEGYGSMTQDRERNLAYRRGITAWARRRSSDAKERVLEIGPGADAVLTRILIEQAGSLKGSLKRLQVLALEGNPKACHSARARLSDLRPGLVQVLGLLSTQFSSETLVEHLGGPPTMILHELLGMFASCESVAFVIRDLIDKIIDKTAASATPTTPAWLPAAFGTFYQPVLLDHQVRVPAVAVPVNQPRLLLTHDRLALRDNRHRLSPCAGLLEWFDTANEDRSQWLRQQHTAEFTVQEDNCQLNALVCFIHIEFDAFEPHGDSFEPSDGRAKRRRCTRRDPVQVERPAPSAETTKTRARQAAVITSARDSTTSSRPAETGDGLYHASNWANPLVFLSQKVQLNRGDKLIVSSDVDLEPQVPSYTFRLDLLLSDNKTLIKIDEFTIGPRRQ